MTVVSSCHNNHPLALLHDPKHTPIKNFWDKFPVELTQDETKLLPVDTGLQFLDNKILKPTISARVDCTTLPLILEKIDKAYDEAMATYRKLLVEATEYDLEVYKKNAHVRIKEKYHPVERFFMSILQKHFVKKCFFTKTVQFARQTLFATLEKKETLRLADAKNDITGFIITNIPFLAKPSENDKPEDVARIRKETLQVIQVYKALFPNTQNSLVDLALQYLATQ